jgi:hypothetical protein
MIETILPLAHAVVIAHHTVLGAVKTRAVPAVHTLASTGTTNGLLSGNSLGSGTLSTGTSYTGLSSVTTGIDDVVKDVSLFGGVSSALGIVWGGLAHTHVFHNERAPEQAKTIVKGSIIGLGTMIAAPVLVNALVSI